MLVKHHVPSSVIQGQGQRAVNQAESNRPKEQACQHLLWAQHFVQKWRPRLKVTQQTENRQTNRPKTTSWFGGMSMENRQSQLAWWLHTSEQNIQSYYYQHSEITCTTIPKSKSTQVHASAYLFKRSLCNYFFFFLLGGYYYPWNL